MDEQDARKLYAQRIEGLIESTLPNGGGSMTDIMLRHVLDQVAQAAFTAGRCYALSSILTCDDIAAMLGMSLRRVNATAKRIHECYGLGMLVGKTWLFTTEDVKHFKSDAE